MKMVITFFQIYKDWFYLPIPAKAGIQSNHSEKRSLACPVTFSRHGVRVSGDSYARYLGTMSQTQNGYLREGVWIPSTLNSSG